MKLWKMKVKLMSQTTKTLKNKKNIFHFLSWLLTFAPILIWLCVAMAKSTELTKTALAISILIAGLLTFVNLLLKYSIRSTVWILLIGIYVALKNITPLLIIIAVCTVIDEFIVHPLYVHYRDRYKINKEIDKRQGE